MKNISRIFFVSIIFLCAYAYADAAAAVQATKKNKGGKVVSGQGGAQQQFSGQQGIPQGAQPGTLQGAAPQLTDFPAGPIIKYQDEDLTKLIYSFQTSSEKWHTIRDPKKREMLLYYFISEYQEKGVKINKPAQTYVAIIDGMSQQSQAMLARPLPEIIKIVAILEYDFNDGQDNDAIAKRLLGEEGYRNNKKRLGLQ